LLAVARDSMILSDLHYRIPLLRRPFLERDQAIRERDQAIRERDELVAGLKLGVTERDRLETRLRRSSRSEIKRCVRSINRQTATSVTTTALGHETPWMD
jgi:hypothetical protein